MVRELLGRRPVQIGAAVTAVATVVAALFASAVPYEVVRVNVYRITGVWVRDAPWYLVRFVGGPVGGAVTGYLVGDRWETCTTYSVVAVLTGLLAVYVAYVVSVAGYALLQGGVPPLMYLLLLVPVLNGIPYAAAYIVGGTGGSVVGMLFRQYRDETLLA